jgi:type II secretory pathway component GspD/PulD (secretin)
MRIIRGFVFVLLLLAVPAGADGLLTRVNIVRAGGTVRVRLSLSARVRQHTRMLSNNLLAVDIFPAQLGQNLASRYPIQAGLVGEASLCQLDAHTVRLQISSVSRPLYQVLTDSRSLTLALSTVIQSKPPQTSSRLPRFSQKRLTAQFLHAGLVNAIGILAKEMGASVYIGPGVNGSVTLCLQNVPVQAALDSIVKMSDNKIGYRWFGNDTLFVAAPDVLNQIDIDYLLAHSLRPRPPIAWVQEVLLPAKLHGFLQEQNARNSSVEFVPNPTRTGFYIVGSQADILAIRNELPSLNHPAAPGREVVAINYGDLKEIKSLLATLVPDVTVSEDVAHSTILLEGSAAAIEQVKELLDDGSAPLDQVVIECRVVSLTSAAEKKLAILWTPSNGRGPRWGPQVPKWSETTLLGGKELSISPLSPDYPGSQLKFGDLVESEQKNQSSLNVLCSSGEAKVMAYPRVATQSGTEAQLRIADKFPIVAFDTRTGIFQRSYTEVGINLEITPNVKKDGYVVCKIRPEVSTLVELINQQWPLTHVRRFETEARIRDDNTFAFGLWDERDLQAGQRIPLLRDLPIFGSLFRQEEPRCQVIVMITPHILK